MKKLLALMLLSLSAVLLVGCTKPAEVMEEPTPAPVVEEPAPVVEVPAPVVEEAAPVVEETAPVAPEVPAVQ